MPTVVRRFSAHEGGKDDARSTHSTQGVRERLLHVRGFKVIVCLWCQVRGFRPAYLRNGCVLVVGRSPLGRECFVLAESGDCQLLDHIPAATLDVRLPASLAYAEPVHIISTLR